MEQRHLETAGLHV